MKPPDLPAPDLPARSASEGRTENEWDTGALPYQVLCMTALLVLLFVEMQRGMSLLGLLVPLVGLLGVLSKMTPAPMLLLLTMAFTWSIKHYYFRQPDFPWDGFRGADALWCGAVLLYVAAHYRLQGLIDSVMPRDPRRRLPERNWLGRRLVAPQPRSRRSAGRGEVGLLVASLPVWVLFGHLAWLGLKQPWNPVDWPVEINRLALFAWFLGVAGVVATAVFGIWGRAQQSPSTAAVVLQDVLWHETRGEQRRLTRWLSWARLKRRGENP